MTSATPTSSDSAVSGRNAWRPALDFVLNSPACMVAAGLLVRVVYILAGRLYHLDTQRWWAFEMANIGYSLALGHGFSSPWRGSTGPTAWTAPLYPWVVSLAFVPTGRLSRFSCSTASSRRSPVGRSFASRAGCSA